MSDVNTVNPVVMMFSAGLGLVVVIYVQFAIYSRLFQKVGPNEALIISGAGGVRIVTAGGCLVFPMIHKVERLSLEMMEIAIDRVEVETANQHPVAVFGRAMVKVRNDEASIRIAAERFLSKGVDEVMSVARTTIVAAVKAVAGRWPESAIRERRDDFATEARPIAAADLERMGLSLEALHITELATGQPAAGQSQG